MGDNSPSVCLQALGWFLTCRLVVLNLGAIHPFVRVYSYPAPSPDVMTLISSSYMVDPKKSTCLTSAMTE